MAADTIEISPGDEDYLYFDWRPLLAVRENNPAIATSTFTLDSTLTLVGADIINWPTGSRSATVSTSGNATRFLATGWVEGKTYSIKNTITLSNGAKLTGFQQVKCQKRTGRLSSVVPMAIA